MADEERLMALRRQFSMDPKYGIIGYHPNATELLSLYSFGSL